MSKICKQTKRKWCVTITHPQKWCVTITHVMLDVGEVNDPWNSLAEGYFFSFPHQFENQKHQKP